MRQITSDNIDQIEKRTTNKFGLFLVILAVIAILGGGGFLLYKYRSQIDLEFKLPWSNKEGDGKSSKKDGSSSSKKNNSDLIIPRTKNNSFYDGASTFSIGEITADDRGYEISAELKTTATWATIKVEKILLDGYNTEVSFELSDEADVGEQQGTRKKFRINQTDLDKLNINGFTRMNIFYVLEEPLKKYDLKMKVITFESEYTVTNGNKGLIKIDEKGQLLIEYNKTTKADNATYIYFEAKNNDLSANREILIKKLMINNRIYEMPEFKETIYRGATQSFYIKIPKDKIRDVDEILVSFYILNKDEKGNNKSIYITNEYSRSL